MVLFDLDLPCLFIICHLCAGHLLSLQFTLRTSNCSWSGIPSNAGAFPGTAKKLH